MLLILIYEAESCCVFSLLLQLAIFDSRFFSRFFVVYCLLFILVSVAVFIPIVVHMLVIGR